MSESGEQSKEKGKAKKRKKKEALVKTANDAQPHQPKHKEKGNNHKTTKQWEEEEGLQVKVLDDGKCLIVSVQMKGSDERRKKLFTWIQAQARPPDVIAIQDPPLSLAWQLPRNYGRWCRGDDGAGNPVTLTEKDCPTYFPYVPPYTRACDKQAMDEAKQKIAARMEAAKQKAQGMSQQQGADEDPSRKKLAKVAFLVHSSIPSWEISEPDPKENEPNCGILVTARIPMEYGSLAIHNFYNHDQRLDPVALMAPCHDEGDVHVCVGDSNWTHERWGGPGVKKTHTEAVELVREMDAIPMHCKNERGKITYGRGLRTKNSWISTLDLFLVSDAITKESEWRMLNVKGYESDHAVTSLSINMDLKRKAGLRYMWDKTNEEEYEKFVHACTRQLELPAVSDRASLSRIMDATIQILHEANEELVPIQRVYEHNPHEQASIPKTSKQKAKNWRKSAERMSNGPRGIHSLAKRASSWGVPRPMTHTPAFKVGSQVFKDNDAKVKCFTETIWSCTRWKGGPRNRTADATATEKDCSQQDDSSTSPTARPPATHPPTSASSSARPGFPLPFLDPQRETEFSPQSLKEGEIRRLIKSAPYRRAYGTDGIAYEAFKMCCEAIDPILSWIFQACLDLRLHPDQFKDCITVVILKPGKPPELPKSYRPIAILNTMAKFLERILADRYKDLLVNAGILPAVQYGAPGRSTTLSLELLTSKIYTGWTKGQKVSLLGLDLTGAYDHIDRNKLLAELIKRRIPDWLIEITWSFLSDRRSFIHLPGYDGDEYWIEIGVPQGSPLSSLLFLLYAAPLLEDFAKDYPDVMLFSYVDDTYIVVAGTTYEANARVMGRIHDMLYVWAANNNLHFSPTKYHVLHFAKPYSPQKDKGYNLLPSMIGFEDLTPKEREDILQPTIKILGVTFDRRLTWEAHVLSLIDRIRKDLATMQRFSGSTWGVTLEKRLQLYNGKLIPKIIYACAAWFLHDPFDDPCHDKFQFVISAPALKLLQSLQIEILLAISKAWKRTNVELIQKELHVFPILLKLYEVAMNHRCSHHGDEEYARIRRTRIMMGVAKASVHPHRQMNELVRLRVAEIRDEQQKSYQGQDFESVWTQLPKRKVWIKDFNQLKIYNKAKGLFDHWRRTQVAKPRGHLKVEYPAYEILTGEHRLSLYVGLDTAQQTLLIEIRTGNIGLNTNPVLRVVTKSTDMSCPLCGATLHTLKHLTFECPKTISHLPALIAAAGHQDFKKFVHEDVELFTSYAIAYFGLSQFDSVKDKEKYQFPRTRTISRIE
ncbi:hypothetical protein ACET3X_004654 [Alternaria dauci]|uniref:Reverse transcriptase domain-containing protein n=1 Tax=Alternaria dauci TaxID=48095 RepID=A0ABR3UNI3_9PLEO